MLRRNSFRLFYRIENCESWLMESKKTSSDGPTSWRETTVGAIRGCVSQEENDFQAHLCSRYGINPGYIQSYVLKPYPTACASTIRRVVYDGWTRETHVRTYVCVSRASTVKLRSCLTTFRLLLWPSWKFPSAQGTQPQNRPSQKKNIKIRHWQSHAGRLPEKSVAMTMSISESYFFSLATELLLPIDTTIPALSSYLSVYHW